MMRSPLQPLAVLVLSALAAPLTATADATPPLPERLYKVPAIATPYKPVLTTEEKVAGLSLFWAEARSSFVHFDHVPDLAWDQVYMDYLAKVIAAPTTRDYYRVMMQLAPLLQDGHTNIYAPKELQAELYARPPLRTVLVEDKVLIERVGNPALQARLQPGEEIVAVDGEPVLQYGRQHIEPFVSASTPQDRALRTYSYQLLMGAAGKPVKLRVRTAAGAERDEMVERSGSYKGPERFVFKTLPGDIAYISIDHFESEESVKMFEMAMPEILKAKGLVIDVRRNGGGSSDFGLMILSWLSRQPIASAASYRRDDNAVSRAHASRAASWAPLASDGGYTEPHKEVFNGPVAVLIGAQTFSAAEDFTVAFRLMKRGVIVGEATGGSTGQPLFFALPGGGNARICVKRDVYPDGSLFVGKGVMPDVEVGRTVAALRSGADPVLDRAIAELRK
ncbi:S41 family peptidase [Duganella sp. HH105]|uniref:S41 family peptidase n=1 Tax=Duganella sp. HH105 TaxID=1781067 RepID=UPI00143A8329|nr:S41 family peptidase [Duganella sp. HH105]